ncbi:MAG: DUF3306 domain-containing protein [Flavobacteriaceae bacterium]
MVQDREGVLSRWSRRKRGQVLDANEEPLPAEAVADEAALAEEPDAGGDEERMLTEADLPDIESLDYGSDFSAFLQKNVPIHLHKMAMRKLWLSDPVIANLDGLNDYDLDYTLNEAMELAAQSAEDLARGTKRKNISDLRAEEREEMRRERERRAAAPAERDAAAQPADGEETVAEAADAETDSEDA